MCYTLTTQSTILNERGYAIMKKILALALAVLMTLCLLCACTPAKDEGKLVMATNANFPPYEYKEGEEYAGIDIELAQEIAEKLGKERERACQIDGWI